MSGNERIKGVQVHRPIIYGSHARLLTDEEKLSAPAGHTHRWTVFFTSAATPLPEPRPAGSTGPVPIDMDYLPGGADDLSYVVKRVVFRLHETYSNPNRMCERPPYQVTETGWGEFTVQIKVTFIPEAGEKALSLQHPIKLHHWGEPIDVPVAPAPGAEATPVGTPATDKGDGEGDAAVKAEVNTPAAEATPAAEGSGATTTEAATGTGAAPTPAADGGAPATAVGTPTPAQAAVQSMAAMYPVHAWQYDELVFSDPPANFMSILDENPPTPLPARPRRARDQREEHDLKNAGSTKKKARGSSTARGGASRAGTDAPEGGSGTPRVVGTPRAGTPAVIGTPGGTGTPGAGTPGIAPGVPGELGSADVPLEFATDMEKGEFNRLTEIRIRIVEQMDRWRERLIAQEKELGRLKEEMR